VRHRRTIRGIAALAVAMGSSYALAAAQVWPTWRLSRMAEADRDFEYLSGFAATPLHLISYVAPGLFHRSPLWRPLAWDPFHTSPEEHLAYAGLVPLCLALGAIARGWRRDPATRALTVVALVTLILSLGPYAPGFEALIRLPGFSFFRSPARWSLATELALALLAARGFDALRDWPRPGRWLAAVAVTSALATGLVVLAIELAIASTDRPGWPSVASGFDRAMRLLPWSGDPPFRDLMATARKPLEDLRVQTSLARQGLPWSPASETVFVRKRRSIYASELGETGAILLALLILSPLASRRRAFGAALVALSAIDLWAVGRHRATDLGPIRPLVSQSPVLARLSPGPRGPRTADPLRNMPMVVGAAPISAYRTLDIPSVPSLTNLAQAPISHGPTDRLVVGALRATGTAVRIFGPSEAAARNPSSEGLPGWEARETIRDPALAGWLYGADLVAATGGPADLFTLWWQPPKPAARAWLVPLTEGGATDILESWSGDPTAVIDLVEHATPLTIQADRPERLDIAVQAEGPARMLVSQLADPLWEARWVGPGGDRPATIVPVLRLPGQGGWQAVTVPGPGAWTLRLEYSGRDVREGLIASAVAWALGIASFFLLGRGGRS
jgi:hypothetical protein